MKIKVKKKIKEFKENIPVTETCPNCGESIIINTYRKFIMCSKCKSRYEFEGFKYKTIDFNRSEYHQVKYAADCPACKGPNFLKWSKHWRCEDCGYKIRKLKKLLGIFWFCDECETFLNVQEGFTTKNKKWTCSECGYLNDVTRKNIL